jgi:hypothetical protein
MRRAASHGYAPAQKLVGKPPFTELDEPVTYPTVSGTFRVEAPLKKEGGTFVLPVQINGAITLDFTVDSGAADVSVPADVFSTLARTGTIKTSDIIGEVAREKHQINHCGRCGLYGLRDNSGSLAMLAAMRRAAGN